ncbi:ankyrin repeat and protein kinase domain-containing protein 1-like [Penaeus japonicus]|uniref:ankyrin repeat and protein kinase domain-containing protein 1-like n=1 Tax=Penaeus japonicus TaxID=27405 RepID=UPI001C70CC24|nr:ankyrin repeat and protein kinase domain-containing protein 1-like [Penaeus japonicus]XP_042891877.1 ankyrin repeat and protein kinase domain-containing protein 1-like [Penaeus japonicus]XP_042891878.1 ankyrin repeat and protein kinase domain-containing protein 1-like [Penaeus japonicus]XP_042891879.1 ankyrin repeat and protein kinase domain-containing protein 1-like [Penaeus japonicus]XP_042891880.1 ankyrin repeat and protein kinase domain-containing protein 1-like [Penaeus japonicus]XP_04
MTTFARRWNLDSQLLVAIQNNDVPRVHKLFQEGVDTDTRFSINSQQRPALCLCVENNAQDMVQLFVELGVSINQGDSQGLTALHIACSHTYIHLAGLLIKARANVNARTHQNHTPLHLAAMRGSSELVQLLLSHRANVDSLDDDSRTALHYAAGSGNAALVELLLSSGADPSLLDNMGNTPLHYAVDVSGMPAHVVRQLATAHPPAVGILNRNTETPLHIAVRNGRCDAESVLKAALEYGTKEALNAKTSLGHTPLHLAVLDHRINLLRILLTAGADTDTEDHLGHTPLGSAGRDATWGAVALLLAAGARTKRLIHGGMIDSDVQDSGIRALLHDATRQPPKLSSVCRRALTLHLGPASLLALSKTTLPPTWRDFLTYNSINI